MSDALLLQDPAHILVKILSKKKELVKGTQPLIVSKNLSCQG